MRYELDSAKSELIWHASKVSAKHHGHITLASGWVEIDEKGVLSAGEAAIDMATITDDDIKNKSLNQTLTDHLRSADFFDAPTYPTSVIKIKKVTMDGKGAMIQADLTIRDKTNAVEFPAQIAKEGAAWRCKASVTIDRTKWDIKFRSGRFFQGLGEALIHDEITLEVNLVTK